jgi:hypothetical protein
MTLDHARTQSDSVAESVRRLILRRTGDRVRAVAVEIADSVVTVRGGAPSFYLKQLALEAARGGIAGSGLKLRLEVTVDA